MSTLKETAQKLMQKTAQPGGLHTKDIEVAIMEEIVKDRARIREGVVSLDTFNEQVGRAEVLALLTDNIMDTED
jgi:hypothetical protein